jgi:hypothetical protein
MFAKTLLIAFAMVGPAFAQQYAYTIEVSDNRIVYHRGKEVRSGQSNIFNIQGRDIPDGERGFLQIASARTFDVSHMSICISTSACSVHTHQTMDKS